MSMIPSLQALRERQEEARRALLHKHQQIKERAIIQLQKKAEAWEAASSRTRFAPNSGPLLLTRGREVYENFHDMITPGRTKRVNRRETGFPVKFDDATFATIKNRLVKSLPPNFCAYCCRKDVVHGKRIDGAFGTLIINYTYDDLEIRPGDAVTYYMCDVCADLLAWGTQHKPSVIHLAGGDAAKRRMRFGKEVLIEENIISFVRAMWNAGQTGLVIGDASRVERYSDRDRIAGV